MVLELKPIKLFVFNPETHEKVSGVPYILYWAMYNNEVRDIKIKHKNGTVLGIKEKSEDIKTNNEEVVLYIEKQQQGFWLIDNHNVKPPLYYTLEDLYKAQKGFKDVRQNSIE